MSEARLSLGTCAFGRAVDALGAALDGKPPLRGRCVALEQRAPPPNERAPVCVPLWTGVRAIDGLLTFGRGARIGIFGAPGAGKTTLLEAIARGCAADAIVVALVGERGREAQTWIERCDRRTTIVCATGDRPADERASAAHVAVAHAAALRERGLHVLLVLDSLARFAAAARELSVAKGESVGRGGYPPSVFAKMAALLEVAGSFASGSITLVATVLNDGDERDPVSDAARSLLDGHVELAARLAQAGRFPAVDVAASASRTMDAVTHGAHAGAARAIRRAIVSLDRASETRALGLEPSDASTRAAIAIEDRLETFLRQERLEPADWRTTVREALALGALLQRDERSVLNSETLR